MANAVGSFLFFRYFLCVNSSVYSKGSLNSNALSSISKPNSSEIAVFKFSFLDVFEFLITVL